MISPVRTWKQNVAKWSMVVVGVTIVIGVTLYTLRVEPAIKLSPDDVVRIGYFDVATGKPKVYFKRQKNGKFDLFDRPGFHPNTQEPLEPVTPENVQIIEAFVNSEEAKANLQKLLEEEQRRQLAEANRLAAAAKLAEEQHRADEATSHAITPELSGAKQEPENVTAFEKQQEEETGSKTEAYANLATPASAGTSASQQTQNPPTSTTADSYTDRNQKQVNPNDISFDLVRNLVTNYYNTHSEWAGTFTLDTIIRWRLEEMNSGRKRILVEYRYIPVPGNKLGRMDTGVDRRIFDLLWANGSWQVTSMGGYMSANL